MNGLQPMVALTATARIAATIATTKSKTLQKRSITRAPSPEIYGPVKAGLVRLQNWSHSKALRLKAQEAGRTDRIEAMAGTSQLIQIEVSPPLRVPKPEWLRAKAPVGENFHELKKLARGLDLHTVCESAQCPNIGECWNHKTATFMLLGNICTRRCGFCAVPKGRPEAIDWDEPRRVAEAVATLGLKHAVVTSVNRDDDNVGGARIFAETIRQIREFVPGCRVEVLIPDFQGLEEPLRIVLDAKPNVLNHNTETVPRLYRAVRSGARYKRTLDLLSNAKKWDPTTVTKSGVMVGIGEETGELIEVFRDLGECGVDILTTGQYLRPSKDHLPMTRYYMPEEFVSLKEKK